MYQVQVLAGKRRHKQSIVRTNQGGQIWGTSSWEVKAQDLEEWGRCGLPEGRQAGRTVGARHGQSLSCLNLAGPMWWGSRCPDLPPVLFPGGGLLPNSTGIHKQGRRAAMDVNFQPLTCWAIAGWRDLKGTWGLSRIHGMGQEKIDC